MSPKKQEKIFVQAYAQELITIAFGDLKTAIAINKDSEARLENAFYMIQQCIEKSLKAVLIHRGLAVPLVHDLGILISKMPSDLNLPFGYELTELNEYASVRRYENGTFLITHEEINLVVDQAEKIYYWSKNLITESK